VYGDNRKLLPRTCGEVGHLMTTSSSQDRSPERDRRTDPTHGPAVPSAGAGVAFRPLTSTGSFVIGEGFWRTWQELNRSVTIREGARRLQEAGNLHNLRLAAGETTGSYRGPLYLDSDVYKWLEAVAWEQQRAPDPELYAAQEEISALVARAQEPDGYLNSYVQTGNAERYADLPFGHELFCGGHLIQGAVAQHRATGSRTLLDVAIRYADHLVATFGPGRLESADGHPEIEMALVELYRETGTDAYRELARFLVEIRGRGVLGTSRFQPDYYQDDRPVRQTTYVRGHAVRAVFLAAGACDVATETGDGELLDVLTAQWEDMVETKTYLTGGIGSRWDGEAFGNPFELGSEVAYAETCAAHASVLWSWRMLLATGDARYAELVERTLYNAFLPGLGMDGRTFFYVNALQVRPGDASTDSRYPIHGRQPWYSTACCPPNVMRTLASLAHYVATTDEDGVQLQLLCPGELDVVLPQGTMRLQVESGLPHDGAVTIRVLEAPGTDVTVSVRVPAWSREVDAQVVGSAVDAEPGDYLRVTRMWREGDEIELRLDMEPRAVRADPAIDAIGSAVAIQRGPLVYCFEQVDQTAPFDTLSLDDGPLATRWRPELLGGVHTVTAPGTSTRRDRRPGALPYGTTQELAATSSEPVELVAVPYYAWANRTVDAMRVFVPGTSSLP
jgi:uncharacterized protein